MPTTKWDQNNVHYGMPTTRTGEMRSVMMSGFRKYLPSQERRSYLSYSCWARCARFSKTRSFSERFLRVCTTLIAFDRSSSILASEPQGFRQNSSELKTDAKPESVPSPGETVKQETKDKWAVSINYEKNAKIVHNQVDQKAHGKGKHSLLQTGKSKHR